MYRVDYVPAGYVFNEFAAVAKEFVELWVNGFITLPVVQSRVSPEYYCVAIPSTDASDPFTMHVKVRYVANPLSAEIIDMVRIRP